MHWIRINPFDLPSGEVLAGNFKEGTYGYKEKLIGYLQNDDDEDVAADSVNCDSENEHLQNCTHYINIHGHDPSI